jgi:hypothetical protein
VLICNNDMFYAVQCHLPIPSTTEHCGCFRDGNLHLECEYHRSLENMLVQPSDVVEHVHPTTEQPRRVRCSKKGSF